MYMSGQIIYGEVMDFDDTIGADSKWNFGTNYCFWDSKSISKQFKKLFIGEVRG